MRQRLRASRPTETPASERAVTPEQRAFDYLERTPGRALESATREYFEPRFGHDFSKVRVHADSEAASLASGFGASAFTVGDDIVFGGGRFDPQTVVGQRLIAHELVHTLQQTHHALGDSQARTAQPGEASELEATRGAHQALAGIQPQISVPAPSAIALETEAETAAQTAALQAGNLPFLAGLMPDWAWTLGGDGLTGRAGDGMTTRTQHADMSVRDGFGFKLGEARTTEADKDHAMSSNHELSLEDGMLGWGWGGSGRSLADDGTKVADSQQSKVSVAKDGFALENTTSSTRDTVTSSRSMNASWRDGRWQTGLESKRDFVLDEDHQLSSATSASLGSDGANLTRTSSSRIKDADLTGVVNSDAKTTSVGWDKDGPNVARTSSQTTEVDGQKFTNSSQMGYSNGQVSYTRGREHTATDEAGKETKTSSSTGFTAGRDGVGMNTSSSSADGSKRSAGFTVSPDSLGANGSMTTAGGNTVSGGVKIKDGNVSGEAGFSRKGVSVSLSGGVEVEAKPPRAEGGRFVVDWVRTVKGGGNAGGGKGGAKIEAGGSLGEREFGSRSFATEKEALEFQENAAKLVGDISAADTIAGAMRLGIGETRGHGEDTNVSAGGSMSVSGGGSFSAGAHKNSTEQLSVRRVSQTIFEVTALNSGEHGYDGGAGTFAGGAKGHTSSDASSQRTLRFDLSTTEGQAAFEAYQRDPSQIPPHGATLVSSTDTKGSEHGTTVNLLGDRHQNDRTSRTEESVTVDEQGKTETYTGKATETVSTKLPWEDSHLNVGTQFTATEKNDSQSQYALTGSVDASSGADSMENLAEITGMVHKDTAGAKSSGKWGIEVEITEAMVDTFVKDISDEQIRAMGLFDGDDPRNNLRVALKAAETSDDRKRALSHFMADAGHDGKAIKALRNVLWGVVNSSSLSGDYDMMKRNKRGNFNYDLTLPGDRNFRGMEARLELERKINAFEKSVSDPQTAAAAHADIAATLAEVRRQRGEIADPERYTDLPHELRETQVARLDKTIARLQDLRDRSGKAAVEQGPEGSAGNLEELQAAKAQMSDPKQFKGLTKAQRRDQSKALDAKINSAQREQAKLSPDQIALSKLRGEVKDVESYLKDDKKQYQIADQAFRQMSKELLKSKRAASSTAREARQLETEARKLQEAAAALERGVSEWRSQFLGALGNPQQALVFGRSYLGALQAAAEMWSQAEMKMNEALDLYVSASTEDLEEPEAPEPLKPVGMSLR
jgi:hypothetical protein